MDEPQAREASARPLSIGAAWLTQQALREVSRPAEEAGWERFANSRQIAWKTGTSWGLRDAWAIGSSTSHTVGVWVGNADGRGVPALTGGSAAAPLLFALHEDLPRSPWYTTPMGALKSVGGMLQIASIATLETASFPALTTIGGASVEGRLNVMFSGLRRLDLPALTTINGSAELRSLGSLCSVNMRRVSRVTGRVDIDTLPNVPFSALSALRNASGSNNSVLTAGCCYPSDSLGCTDSSGFECTTSQCP